MADGLVSLRLEDAEINALASGNPAVMEEVNVSDLRLNSSLSQGRT